LEPPDIGTFRQARNTDEGDSLKMIPLWSIALAIGVSSALSMWWFNHGGVPAASAPGFAADAPDHELYRRARRWPATHLLIGYVSRDVRRRHMSAPLWMLIVVVMPGGIGAVVYFLLRQPIIDSLSELYDGTDRGGSLLPAVPVPGCAGVRTMLPRSADYRRVLSAVRPRNRRRSRSGQAARLQR
jgi:hypothetical protein